MRFQSRKHHIIDILFPISLYFVFTVSALAVLLLATNVYRHNPTCQLGIRTIKRQTTSLSILPRNSPERYRRCRTYRRILTVIRH